MTSINNSLSGFENIFNIFQASENERMRWVLPMHTDLHTQLIFEHKKWEVGGMEQIEIRLRFQTTGKTIFYGSIPEDGIFTPSRRLRAQDKPARRELWEKLKALRADPYAVLTSEGKRTGVCCICTRELTDPASVKAGIGPVCAKNIGFDTTPQLDLSLQGASLNPVVFYSNQEGARWENFYRGSNPDAIIQVHADGQVKYAFLKDLQQLSPNTMATLHKYARVKGDT